MLPSQYSSNVSFPQLSFIHYKNKFTFPFLPKTQALVFPRLGSFWIISFTINLWIAIKSMPLKGIF